MEESRYFDHEADIGIIGRGETIEDAFVDAAKSTFAIMLDLTAIKKQQSIEFDFSEDDTEIALVRWLNLLIAHARSHGLALAHFELTHKNKHWHGSAYGEPWNDILVRGTEVKGATLTMLSVNHDTDGWEARCVVDV